MGAQTHRASLAKIVGNPCKSRVNAFHPIFPGYTPAHLCALRKDVLPLPKAILESPFADINEVTYAGNNVLMVAMATGNSQAARFILRNHATPSHSALFGGGGGRLPLLST